MKKTLGLLVILSASLLLAACSGNKKATPETKKDPNTISVASFNLSPNAQVELEKQGNLLKDKNFDLVALQEVDKNTKRSNYDATSRLQKIAGYEDAFFSKHMALQGGDFGLAVLSNLPMSNKTTIPIYSVEAVGDEKMQAEARDLYSKFDSADPESSEKLAKFQEKANAAGKLVIEPKVIQHSTVDVNGKTLSVYAVNLSPENVVIRDKQRAQLVDMLNKDTNKYQLILGNFNSNQGTKEMNYFIKNYNLANGKDGKWHDTLIISSPGIESYSVDNIVTTKNIKISNVKYTNTKLSYHMLISADLTLK